MLELELKGVVSDLEAVRERLEGLGARRQFVGRLEDRRLDDAAGTLRLRDEMLRVRAYRAIGEVEQATLDWKGPPSRVNGYKQREELIAPVSDSSLTLEVLARVGFCPAVAIDRDVWQYELDGVMVRLERYPRMDDLVEIEGEPEAMERVVARLGLDRATLGSDSVFAFARRFAERTGERARLSHDGPDGLDA